MVNSQLFTAFAWRSIDGGRTWSHSWLPSVGTGISSVSGLSCADALQCVGVGIETRGTNGNRTGGFIVTTSDGGATWTVQTSPATAAMFLGSVSCATTQDCWAGGLDTDQKTGTMIATQDGGKSWSPVQIPPTSGVGSLDCLPDGSCYAISSQAANPVHSPASGSQDVLTNHPRN